MRTEVADDPTGDGYPDLVTRHGPKPLLTVLINAGDGTFSAPTDYELASEPHGVAVADLNTDGMNDVIAVSGGGEEAGQLQVFLNRGDGALGAPVNYTVGSFPLDANPADLNNDGTLDLLVTSCMDGVVHGLVNDGEGAFSHLVDYAVGGCPVFTKMVAAEDGAGHTLLISDFDGTMTLLPASIFSLP